MRSLSERQARSCEEAHTPRCACRCNGALHGGRRGGDDETPREWFEQLPAEDPHYLEPRLRQLSIAEALEGLVFRPASQEEIDQADELAGTIALVRPDGRPFNKAQRELLFGELGARA